MSQDLPRDETSSDLVLIGKAAEILGVSIDTVRRWDKAGKLRSVRPDGKNRYFSLEELNKIKRSRPLKVTEAAKRLGVSASTLRRREQEGLVTPDRGTGGARLYTQETLQKLAESRELLGKKQAAKLPTEPEQLQPVTEEIVAPPPDELREVDQVDKPRRRLSFNLAGFDRAFRRNPTVTFVTGFALALLVFTLVSHLSQPGLAEPLDPRAQRLARREERRQRLEEEKAKEEEQVVLGIADVGRSLLDRVLAFLGILTSPLIELGAPIIEQYATIITGGSVAELREVVTTDEEGQVATEKTVTISQATLVRLAESGVIENLNAEFLQGRVPGPEVGDLAIFGLGGRIAALRVSSANLLASAVSGGLSGTIVDASITADDLAGNAVTAGKIKDGEVKEADLADDAVTSSKIKDGEVKEGELADSGVTAAKIKDDTITTSDLSATLTFADGDFVDLASILHNDAALQGLRLPNVSSATPTSPASGEGFISYDTAGNQALIYDGSAWTAIGGGVTLTTTGGDGADNSNSGLELLSDELTLLKGCTADQVLKWDDTNALWECQNDNNSGGATALDALLAASTDDTAVQSGDNTIIWEWALTSATSKAFTIGESAASTGGSGDQALVEITTLTNSTASPLQVTAGGTGAGDIWFDLTGTSDLEIRDNGTAIATFGNAGDIDLTAQQGAADALRLISEAGGIDISAGSGTGDIDILSGDAINLTAVGGNISLSSGTGQSTASGLTVDTSGDLTVGDNDLFVDISAGNVGIGTTGPQYRLQVGGRAGGFDGGSGAMFDNGGAGQREVLTLSAVRSAGVEGANNDEAQIRFLSSVNDDGGGTQFLLGSIGILAENAADTVRDGAIVFRPGDNEALTERMRITSAGNVGIGDTSPEDKLDIEDANLGYNFLFGSGGITFSTSGTSGINTDSFGQLSFTSSQGAADALELISTAGGIDLSTGGNAAGNDIDILSGSSVVVRAEEAVADAILLRATNGGIDLSSGGASNDIDLFSSQSVNVRLGEAAGVDDFNILDAGNVVVAHIDSDGALTVTSCTGCGGGGGNFDATYAQSVTDNDLIVDVDDTRGLVFDMTTTGDFVIADNSFAIATFGNTGSIDLSARENAADSIRLFSNLGGIDLSTGGDTHPIDILSGASINLIAVGGTISLSAGTGQTAQSGLTVDTSGDVTTGANLITSNLGLEITDSDINPGCASGEYKIYADTSELILKKCQDGSATDLDTTGGSSDLDAVYGNDADKELTVSNTTGLIFNMTTSGDFIIQDNGTATATFGNAGDVDLTAQQGAADALRLVSEAGGIDISTGGDGAGNDIDLLSGSSVVVRAEEAAADAILLRATNGGIDLSSGGTSNDIDLFSSQSVNVRLGEAAGVDDFNILNAGNVVVASIDSEGALIVTGCTGCGGGGGNFDATYAQSVTDNDLIVDVDDSRGLVFDLTTTGDFVIADNSFAIATFGNTGSIDLSSGENAADSIRLFSNLGGIDISTGGDTHPIDILSGAALNLTAGGAFSIDGTGASNVTAASGDLTLSTTGSGDLLLTSAAATTLTSTSGTMTFNAAGQTVDLDATTLDVDTTGQINLNSAQAAASSVVVSSQQGGIDISTGGDTHPIDILSGAAINLAAVTGDISLSAGSPSYASGLTVDATNGYVGIGTATPASLLSVTGGDIKLGTTFKIGTNLNTFFYQIENSGASYLVSAGNFVIDIDSNNDQTDRIFEINTNTNSAAGKNLLTIQESGNVGIGTASPSDKLDIEDANLGYNFLFGSGGITFSTSGTSGINTDSFGQLSYTSNQNAASSIELVSTIGGIDLSTGGDTHPIDILSGASINLTAVGGTISLSAGTTTAQSGLTVDNAGEVGIGVGAPARILHVGGAMRIDTTSAPGSPAVGDIYSDGTNLYFYDGAFVDLTSGAAGGDPDQNFDGVFSKAVADADLTMNMTSTSDLNFRMDSTGDFVIQNNEAAVATFGNTGSIDLSSGENAADSIILFSNLGGIDISTGGDTHDIDVLSGASLVLRAEEAVADAVLLRATNGGIDLSSGGASNDIDLLSSQSVNVRLGEAAGVDDFNVLDAGNVVVASIDSDGNLTVTSCSGCGGGGAPDTARFTDSTAELAVDADTTDYWDGTYPNITPDDTNNTVLVSVTIAVSQSSGNADNFVFARLVREDDVASSTPSCDGTDPQVGNSFSLGFTTASGAVAGGAATFLDSPSSTAAVYYTVCSSVDSGGVAQNIDVIEVVLTELGADLAENYYTTDDSIKPGHVVSLDATLPAGAKKSSRAYDANVLGIVSTAPGITLDDAIGLGFGRPVPVALVGRVPVKVTVENGPIGVGDFLTSSSTPGVAMRATKAGSIVGQALTEYGGEGVGSVLAFVITGQSHGVALASLLPGLAEGSSQTEAEFGRNILAELLSQRETLEGVGVSEMFIDRLAAGIEVITPRVTTETLAVDSIQSASGGEIALNLSAEGQFTIRNEAGKSVISFDSEGNAFFAGTVTADKLRADKIEGLELITNKLTLLSGLISGGEETAATESGTLGAAEGTISVERLARLDEFEARQATDSGKLTTGSLRVLGSALIESVLNVVDTITAPRLIIDKLAYFFGEVVFKGAVRFQGRPTFNQDTAGFALIRQGAQEVAVGFEKEYTQVPIVTVSTTFVFDENKASDEEKQAQQQLEQATLDIHPIVTNQTVGGFTVKLNKRAPEDLRVSWAAVAVEDARTTVSGPGAIEPAEIPVEVSESNLQEATTATPAAEFLEEEIPAG